MRFDNGVFELAAGRSSQLPAGDLPEIEIGRASWRERVFGYV